MISKKTAIFIWIISLLIPIVSAANIDIKTLPNHDVQITLFDEHDGEFLLLERLEDVSDENGDVSFTQSTESSFNLIVFVKERGKTILSEKYLRNYDPRKDIKIKILPDKKVSKSYQKVAMYALSAILVFMFAFIILNNPQKLSHSNNHKAMEFEVTRNGKKVSIGKIDFRRRD